MLPRRLRDERGNEKLVVECLNIQIRRGWKEGTKIAFEEKGDVAPGVIPGDVIFVVSEKEHPAFARSGDDLIHTRRIHLADALCGTVVELKHLDGTVMHFPISAMDALQGQQTFPGIGMPNSKTGNRGDLIVQFKLICPAKLTEDQQAQIRKALNAV